MDVRFGSIRALLVSSLAGLLGSVGAAVHADDSEPPEFMHLNYSRMTADEAFDGETLLVVMTVPVHQEPVAQPEVATVPVLPMPEVAAPGDKVAAQASPSAQRGDETTGTQPIGIAQANEPRSSAVAIRSLQASGLEVGSICDITPLPHNGCKPPKRRRV